MRLAAGVVAAIAIASPVAAAPKAYYTAAQAKAGASLFATNCAMCHGAKLQGISCPALVGSSMKGSRTIADLYTYVTTNMPAGRAGQLSAPVYAAIIAFLLQKNGHPFGKTPLSKAAAAKIAEKI